MMLEARLQSPFGLDHIHVGKQPEVGAPGPDEILVRIHACSLNFHDLLVAKGITAPATGRVPLSDGAGVVEAAGPDVSDFQVGDHVVSCFFPTWQTGRPTIGDFSSTPGDGAEGFARTYVVAPQDSFTKAPAGYSHLQAATLPTAGVTAWRALVVNGQLQAGQTVLLLGTGGVSIFALQIAKALGAKVIITSSSDDKLKRAKILGADICINYRTEPQWGQRVLAETGGVGVDHVVEVGGPGTLAQSILACRIGGHIALIGVLTGAEGPVPTAFLMARQIRLQGLIVGSREHQRDFAAALERYKITPVIDRDFPLEKLPDAFRFEEQGGHFGKIGVTI